MSRFFSQLLFTLWTDVPRRTCANQLFNVVMNNCCLDSIECAFPSCTHSSPHWLQEAPACRHHFSLCRNSENVSMEFQPGLVHGWSKEETAVCLTRGSSFTFSGSSPGADPNPFKKHAGRRPFRCNNLMGIRLSDARTSIRFRSSFSRFKNLSNLWHTRFLSFFKKRVWEKSIDVLF